MPRYFLTAQQVSKQCGIIHVDMVSKPQEHLWLLWTTLPPYQHRHPDRRQNTPVPHHTSYDVDIQGVVEQNEPGETILHTFDFPWPAAATVLWFYSINKGVGPTKATRSPFFVYKLNQQVLLDEQWQSGFPGPNKWRILLDPAPATFNANGGSLRSFIVRPFGAGFTPAVVWTLPDASEYTGTDICDLSITYESPGGTNGPFYNAPAFGLRFAQGLGSIPFSVDLFQGTADRACDFGYYPAPLHRTGSAGGGTHFLHLPSVVSSGSAPCPDWIDQPGTVQLTDIYLVGPTGASFQVGITPASWGRITLVNTGGPLEDISLTWKGAHLFPRLP